LIDVREPDEVIQGSIPSSVNIPLSVLPGSLRMNEVLFEEKFGFKKPKTSQEIVFYCRSGVRAATAGDIAKKNGYEKLVCQASTLHDPLTLNHVRLYNYRGSWLEWVQKEGHKVGTS
jgi:rhodanese-related sulfurtransferase